ncbi:DoxX family protein [Archangium violaceum]|uniref:DoxX family protein n=1 Tax=Archangium violaceum TaxID=83451 RepID=UPI00193B7BBA|nr:DoxX family protein [Archangium violaceum]QRK13239.1 DoxX family protein [Archangium violaceum]
MAPLLVFVVVTLLARFAGSLNPGRGDFATLPGALRAGVAALFVLTGGAHFIGMRADLMRRVPPVFGNPGFWVTLTGLAELAGAIGILIPVTRRISTVGLLLLLLAVFPANVYAATHQITLAGEAATPLLQRGIEQIVYFAAVLWAGFGRTTEHRS